jgi:hypothetical protein
MDEPTYRAVQAIYYPGFTIGGFIGEFGGMIVLAALLFVTPTATERFWWTAAALGFLLAGHAVYWDIQVVGAGRMFFGRFAAPGSAASSQR